jgi:hypothetical protein
MLKNQCGESISKTAPQASKDLLQAQRLLTRGLLIGWNNPSGEFAAVPPPAAVALKRLRPPPPITH